MGTHLGEDDEQYSMLYTVRPDRRALQRSGKFWGCNNSFENAILRSWAFPINLGFRERLYFIRRYIIFYPKSKDFYIGS